MSNAQALCAQCNLSKSDKMTSTFQGVRLDQWESNLPLSAPTVRVWQREAINRFHKYVEDEDYTYRFTLKADTGFGKTGFALMAAHSLLMAGLIDWVVIIAPQALLPGDIIREANAKFGLQLSESQRGRCRISAKHDGFQGEVLTYAELQNNTSAYRRITEIHGKRMLLVLDEIHHLSFLSEEKQGAWAAAVQDGLNDNVPLQIGMTGTLFRSDAYLIPKIPYEASADNPNLLTCRAHYSTNRIDGIRNNWTRRLLFYTVGGRVKWMESYENTRSIERLSADLSDPSLAKQEQTTARAIAASPKSEIGRTLTEMALANLMERRAARPNAGMLVACRDVAHADEMLAFFEGRGVKAVKIVSEDDDSHARRDQFKTSSDPVLITVRMVTEGVNIPRLEVGLCLTNIDTRLFKDQLFGRTCRNISGSYEDSAWYLLATPSNVAYALDYEREYVHEFPRGNEEPPVAKLCQVCEVPTGKHFEACPGQRHPDCPRTERSRKKRTVNFSGDEIGGVHVTSAGASVDAGYVELAKQRLMAKGTPLVDQLVMVLAEELQAAGIPLKTTRPTKPLVEQVRAARDEIGTGVGHLGLKVAKHVYGYAPTSDQIGNAKKAVLTCARVAGFPSHDKSKEGSTQSLQQLEKKVEWVTSEEAFNQAVAWLRTKGGR